MSLKPPLGKFRAALLALSLAGSASAQFRAVDPLTRPTSGAGGLGIGLGAVYGPDAARTDDGLFIRHEGSLSLAVTYNLTDDLRITANGRLSGLYRGLSDAGGTVGRWTAAVSDPSFGLDYDLGGPFAPSVGLELSVPWRNPWTVGMSVSASVLRDPVLLDATVVYTLGPAFGQAVTVAAGTAVVLNDDLTLRGDAAQSLSIRSGTPVLPTTDLSVRSSLRLDERQALNAGVGLRTTPDGLSWRLVAGYRFRR